MNRQERIFLYSRDVHALAAEKIRNNPELLITLQIKNDSKIQNINLKNSLIYYLKWKEILNQGVEATINMFLKPCEKIGDYEDTLRSCSPCSAIITDNERSIILNKWLKQPVDEDAPEMRKKAYELSIKILNEIKKRENLKKEIL